MFQALFTFSGCDMPFAGGDDNVDSLVEEATSDKNVPAPPPAGPDGGANADNGLGGGPNLPGGDIEDKKK